MEESKVREGEREAAEKCNMEKGMMEENDLPIQGTMNL